MELYILESVLKEVKDNKVIYYYQANDFVEDKDKAGIFEFDLSVFYNAEGQKDMSMYVLQSIIDKKVAIIKYSQEPMLMGDGFDYNVLTAIRYLLEKYLKEKRIPEEISMIFGELAEKVFKNDDFINELINSGSYTDEEIEELKKEYSESKEQ